MNDNFSRLEVLDGFGYRKDPFKDFRMETGDSLRIKRLVRMAIDSRSMVSIVAGRGSGKTNALALAFREDHARVINLITSENQKISVGDVERALLEELTAEPVKRSREVRARQLRRILGEASRISPVVLLLEESHWLDGRTLRSLKRMREMAWMGLSPLFTVVLIGQFDPMRKRGMDEVRLRSDTVHMIGLTASEVQQYVQGTVGKCFEADAIEAVSRLDCSRNFLDLQECLISLMAKGLSLGQKTITALEVFDLYGGGIKEVLRKTGITLADIEKETGIHKSTLSLVSNEKQGTLTDTTYTETRQAIADVIRRRTQPASQPEPGLKAIGEVRG